MLQVYHDSDAKYLLARLKEEVLRLEGVVTLEQVKNVGFFAALLHAKVENDSTQTIKVEQKGARGKDTRGLNKASAVLPMARDGNTRK